MPEPQDTQPRSPFRCPSCDSDLAGLQPRTPCPECGSLIPSPEPIPDPPPTTQPPTECVNCGYNLKGLAVRTPCPECGTPIPDPKAHESEILDDFVFCTSCGYHLKGLSRHAHCPECGERAANSAIPQSLYRSTFSYLKELRSGFRDLALIHAALLVGFILLVAGPALLFPLLGSMTSPMVVTLLTLLSLVVFLIMFLLAWLRATIRDRTLGRHTLSEESRKLTRSMAFINFLLYLPGFFCLAPFLGATGGGLILLPVIYLAAAITHLFAATTYAQRLVQRTGARPTNKRIDRAKFIMQIATPLLIISLLVYAGIATTSPWDPSLIVFGILTAATAATIAGAHTYTLILTSRELRTVQERTTRVHESNQSA